MAQNNYQQKLSQKMYEINDKTYSARHLKKIKSNLILQNSNQNNSKILNKDFNSDQSFSYNLNNNLVTNPMNILNSINNSKILLIYNGIDSPEIKQSIIYEYLIIFNI